MAIAFGHKDGEWKSRYTFTPSMMVGYNKEMISQGVSSSGVHRHNVGSNNSFYGTTGRSGVSVAFNDNLSANKVFKSVSVEGSESLKNGAHTIYPYRSTDKSDYYNPRSINRLKSKGGMLYSTVQRSDDLVTGATVFYVGEVIGGGAFTALPVPDQTYLSVKVDTTGSDYVPSGNVQYGLLLPNGDLITGNNIIRRFSEITSYREVQSRFSLSSNLDMMARSRFEPGTLTCDYTVLCSSPEDYTFFIQYLTFIVGGIGGLAGAELIAFKNPDVHGVDLRGQRAEMFLDLGSDDFELYAINLNYEPVNSDHTK